MPGQSVTPVSLSLHFPNEKKVFRQDGPLLITHWGLSGPAVLKLSAFAAPELFHHDYKAKLLINFLPEHNEESLYQQYMLLKKENPERSLNATKPSSMSRRFWARFIETVDLDQNSPMQDLSKGKLRRFCKSMCAYELFVEGKGIFKEEFVTCGGVPRHEIDYRSMESKINPGLFIVGEITDVDGITGGFNFQNAWTGGWLAANKISEILPAQV
jgi:predicted Rossmann fold flavoprotein